MAIVNGKRLYNSQKLAAVAREDDRAAVEYSWLMAGISDDFGRFRLSPRRILGRAYEHRPGVNELMIGDWLAMFEKHGLLKLYSSGGSQYAEWTNYMGDPPSQRHYHSCPEPEWSTHKHKKECKFRDDAETTRRGSSRTTLPPTSVPTRTPTPLGTPPLPAVTAVTTVTTEKKTTTVAAPRQPSWVDEAVTDWDAVFKKGSGQHGKIGSGLKPIVTAHGWDTVRGAWRRYLADPSQEGRFKSPANFAERFALWVGPQIRAAPPSAKAQAKDVRDLAMIQAGMEGPFERSGMGQGHVGTDGPPEPRRDAGAGQNPRLGLPERTGRSE